MLDCLFETSIFNSYEKWIIKSANAAQVEDRWRKKVSDRSKGDRARRFDFFRIEVVIFR